VIQSIFIKCRLNSISIWLKLSLSILLPLIKLILLAVKLSLIISVYIYNTFIDITTSTYSPCILIKLFSIL